MERYSLECLGEGSADCSCAYLILDSTQHGQKLEPICTVTNKENADKILQALNRQVSIIPEKVESNFAEQAEAFTAHMVSFPRRDPSIPAEQQGMFQKFYVTRTDGSSEPGGKHEHCNYFVLDLVHDKHAPDAMRAYATACASTHPILSAEIFKQFGEDETQKVIEELREDLSFVERWANHHGTHPNITAQETLSMIQHYPAITAITKSYKDGVIPDTPNPYKEIEELRQKVSDLQEALDNLAPYDVEADHAG